MANYGNKQFQAMMNQFNDYLAQQGAKMAQQIARGLSKGYDKAMNDFYDSYEPKVYKRTYNFRHASNYAKGKALVTHPSKLQYLVSLKVDPIYMNARSYTKSHGWLFPPYSRSKTNTQYYDTATGTYKDKQKKSVLKTKEDVFHAAWQQGSHGGYAKSTPPVTIMDREYDKWANDAKMETLTKKYIRRKMPKFK